MTTYDFNPAVADTTRDQMSMITKRIMDELESLHANVMTSTRDWDDLAKDAYLQAKQQWDAAAQRMPGSLAKAEMVLNKITDGYLKIEHTGVNQFWAGYSVK